MWLSPYSKIKKMKKILTIAGSDSGGGAGIQADLKTFAALGVYGTSVITAVTAQNTFGVQKIFPLPAAFVGKQISSVMDDIGADAIKIGMLANKEIVEVVVQSLKKYKTKFVVLDPVMLASSGDALFKNDAKRSLLTLFSLSYVVTPNLDEVKAFIGLTVRSVVDMKQAAVALHKMGKCFVVVKGGHLKNDYSIDVLYDGKKFFEFGAKRIDTKNSHGTGCTFSSAIAAQLAKGNSLYESVKSAKEYTTNAIKSSRSMHIGRGHGPLNHMFLLYGK